MFTPTVSRLGPNHSTRKILRLSPFILSVVWIFAQSHTTTGSIDHPSLLQSYQQKPNPEAQPAPEVTTLEPGKPIERELSGGQKHVYQIQLAEGQFVRVVIKQQGINLGAAFRPPGGGETISLFDPLVIAPQEPVIGWVAKSAGIHQYEVFARAKAAPGRYEIAIAELRPATDSDRELQQARDSYNEYWRLHRQGKFLEARPFLQRSIEIKEKLLGPDDISVALQLGNLAANYSNIGDYVSAEPVKLRELKIMQKALGPDHPAVAAVLSGLGSLYLRKGDYLKAEETDLKALGILERSQQTETYEISSVASALGGINYARGDYEIAEKYYQQSRAVLEKIFGPDHFHLTSSYTVLGRVAYDSGDYAKAEAMFQRALTLSEKALGPDHLAVTGYRNDLASVYATTGDYVKAEALYRQALSTHEQKAALSDPVVQETLFGLAGIYAARGMPLEALKFQTQASELEERYIGLNLAGGSERQKLAFLDKLSLRSSRNISLHANLAPQNLAARELAVTTILQRKGRVQDAMAESLAALRLRLGADSQSLLDRLDELTVRLAKLILSGPQEIIVAERLKQVRALEEQRENLEAEVSRSSAGFYERTKPVTLAAVQRVIPADAALIEFAVYRPFDPKAPDNKAGNQGLHYIAYVIRREGLVQWQELGKADSIDAAIDAWRKALRDPQSKDLRLAQTVDEKVMRPMRSLLGDATHLLISPDGAFNLIPFGALIDERGRYLIERYSLTYLTSGRDLLRMQAKRQSRSQPVVVADPAFGEPAVIASRDGKGRGAEASEQVHLDYSRTFFGPLPGVGAEVRALRELLPQATFFTKDQATKLALKRVSAPSILHIATHGFFLQNDSPEKSLEAKRVKGTARLSKAFTHAENPLLRSGLALAGANEESGGNGDGILTALEMAHLDLWGTKLVVLSACDTGIGEVKNGEGVYGLRRALVLAGAESQLMSLWPVSDRSTRDLMIGYYEGLLQNEGRSQALRRVQLQLLRRKDRGHPYYWASFIQSGEWGNLKGER